MSNLASVNYGGMSFLVPSGGSEDTGWLSVNTHLMPNVVYYRKINGIVCVCAHIITSETLTLSGASVAILPSGFRPKVPIFSDFTKIIAGSYETSIQIKCWIDPEGDIILIKTTTEESVELNNLVLNTAFVAE